MTPWYKDPTNPLVVNHEHGDFAATALVYGAELTDLRFEVKRLRRALRVAVHPQSPTVVRTAAQRALHSDQQEDTCSNCDDRRVRSDAPGSVGGCAPCPTCSRKTDALKTLMEFGKRLMASNNEDERGIGWCICEGARIIEEGNDDVQS